MDSGGESSVSGEGVGVGNDIDPDRFLDIKKKQLEEIRMVYNDCKTLTRGQMEGKYKDFAEKYPKTWYRIIVDKDISISQLERQIELYEKFYKKAKGGHDNKQFQASLDMGEHLAKEYLYPVIGEPSKEEKDRAMKIVRKRKEDIENGVYDKPPDVSKMTKLNMDKMV